MIGVSGGLPRILDEIGPRNLREGTTLAAKSRTTEMVLGGPLRRLTTR